MLHDNEREFENGPVMMKLDQPTAIDDPQQTGTARPALYCPHPSLTMTHHTPRPDQLRLATPMYSVAAAAAITGLSQTTVLRAIQAGHISGTKNEINEWQVDPAEFHRLYSSEVTRLARENTLRADGAAARHSGRAEAICSKARLSDVAQAKRLSGLADSDQKMQQAARTRWWRLVIGLQESFRSPGPQHRRTY